MIVRAFLVLLLVAGGLGGLAWWRARTPAVPRVQHEAPPEGGALPPAPEPTPSAPEPRASPATTGNHADPEAATWIETNNRAAQALEEGRTAEAVELLERCHAARPEDALFRRNLAEALVRRARELHDDEGRVAEGAALLERALGLGTERPDREALRALLERWRREAAAEEDDWTDRSLYFELSFDADRFDLLAYAQHVLDELERMYGELRDWFGRDPVIEDGRPRLRVVLYGSGDFARVTGLGDWAGGAFDGVIRISLDDLSSERAALHATLRHELVHAFVREVAGGRAPGWLDEGLAQWLELAPSSAVVRAESLRRARARLAGGAPFPLEELRGSLATWADPERIRRAYAQSLWLVGTIATDPNYGEEALRRMLQAAGRGESPEEAFERFTSVPLAFVLQRLEGPP